MNQRSEAKLIIYGFGAGWAAVFGYLFALLVDYFPGSTANVNPLGAAIGSPCVCILIWTVAWMYQLSKERQKIIEEMQA